MTRSSRATVGEPARWRAETRELVSLRDEASLDRVGGEDEMLARGESQDYIIEGRRDEGGRTGMRIAELKKAKYRSPFRPFLIRMADGSEIQVSHPDDIARDAKSRTAACPSGGGCGVIDIEMIMSPSDASKT
jgi:hypothetical protein